MNKIFIVSYLNFLRLSDNTAKVLSENEDFFVSINAEEFVKLLSDEKKKLRGVALTSEKPNVSIVENINKEEFFNENLNGSVKKIEQIIFCQDRKVLEQSYKEKHYKKSRPYCPKNILNKKYDSKRKGGR